MNWAYANPAKSGYQWPPFGPPNHVVTDERLAAISKAGWDFVRITVDPGPFLYFEGEQRDRLDEYMIAFIRRVRAAGLDAVIDFHPIRNVPQFAGPEFVKGADTPLFRRYLELLTRTARVLAKEDGDHLALELLNEPQTGWQRETRRLWQELLQAMHDAARKEAPDLLIILTGARGGSAIGLMELDPAPFRGSNVRYSFHFYLPYEFTHQG